MKAADLEMPTTRLRLKAGTAQLLDAAVHDRRRLERLLGAAVPQDWPPAENLGFLRSVHEAVLRDPDLAGWGPWLMVLAEEPALVGDVGFKGKPDAEGVVEIGYGVVPAYQRRGLATEAVVGLIAWAFSHGVRAVIAETEESNAASGRVLRKAGLRQVGQIDRMLNWRVEKD
ncbi:MAG TPA: GNAT family N-acetyltransferase [Candidatus Dormibacteraeota bacterium]|nr:GNAT family N-acetyltransferase [Candidatus Dormibacteraeota bacterium]